MFNNSNILFKISRKIVFTLHISMAVSVLQLSLTKAVMGVSKIPMKIYMKNSFTE